MLPDTQGAHNSGLIGYLVATGKFESEHLSEYHITPEHHLHNIRDIINILDIDE